MGEDGIGPFRQLRAVLLAWGATAKDEKRDEHYARLCDSETMLTFGYIVRHWEKSGEPIMQSEIVTTLVEAAELKDNEAKQREAKKVRQDIKRRTDALKGHDLINRKALSKVAVQLSLTEKGQQYARDFAENYRTEIGKLPGKGE